MGNQSAFACSINLRQLVEERQKRNDGVKVINHQIGVNTVHNKILSGHMTMEASQLEQSCYYLIMPAQPVITIGGTMGYIVEVSSIQILASGEKVSPRSGIGRCARSSAILFFYRMRNSSSLSTTMIYPKIAKSL